MHSVIAKKNKTGCSVDPGNYLTQDQTIFALYSRCGVQINQRGYHMMEMPCQFLPSLLDQVSFQNSHSVDKPVYCCTQASEWWRNNHQNKKHFVLLYSQSLTNKDFESLRFRLAKGGKHLLNLNNEGNTHFSVSNRPSEQLKIRQLNNSINKITMLQMEKCIYTELSVLQFLWTSFSVISLI